ncbi:autotransporter domain-containing protein [Mesorhizobium sangaii]|uniref:Subtilase-type serine protease n=1 Tax=Mesorhizobium sangaii TaxID=505389 RepID=A0A841PNE6_9HYPH|nr:autotransporter serine protease [Mesorhizobium sangaii]MBB6414188.1 subtilase-type serine protease [Mesorhizobium sangaii]
MTLYNNCTKSSAHPRSLSTFRKYLKTTALTAALLAAASAGSEAQQYVRADGRTTSDLEGARASWRHDVEFNGNVGLGGINADAAYALGFTGKGATIGFIDQPVWAAHPEFAGRLTFLPTSGTRVYTDPYIPVEAGDPFVADGRQFIDRDDISMHGTHVAGIAGANRDGAGTMGVAFDADLFAASNYDPGPEDGRVRGNDGAVYGAAWQAMIDSGVDIITNSWGIGLSRSPWSYAQAYSQFQEIEAIRGTPDGGAYDGAIKAARSGIVVEFSAGNDHGLEPDAMAGLASFVPDIEKYWLTTMSVVADAESPQGYSKSSFSSNCGYAKYYCIAAPGTQINSSIPAGDITGLKPGDIVNDDRLHPTYDKFNGTSMAGPFATGAFAVLKERYPYLANGEVNEILKTTSTDLGEAGVDAVFGWGRIDLEKALKGPAQFLERFEAKLPGFYRGSREEVWSNDISQDALDQRRGEDQRRIADWEAKKIAERWQDGVTEEVIQKIRNDVAAEVTPDAFNKAIELVRAREEADDALFEGGSEEALDAADKAMKANPIAVALWKAFDALTPNTSIPRTAQFVEFTGTPEGNLDTIRGGIAEERVAGAISELNAYEALVTTLTAKLTDPGNYLGGLTKSGAGTVRLTGRSTYRGDTLINGGLLAVDGSITSKVVVNSLGTLGGIGAVGGIEAAGGGVVSPGNSIGTLTSTGDVIFNKGSALHIEIDGNNGDQLVVNGATTLLGGVVVVTPEASADPRRRLKALMDQTYIIVTSTGGVSGKFDGTQGFVFFDTTLSYLPNEVRLDVSRNGHGFADFALTRNQKTTAAALEALGLGNAIHNTVALATPADSLSATYQSLSGEIHATLKGVLAQDGQFIGQAAIDRMRSAFGGVAGRPQSTVEPVEYGAEAAPAPNSAFAAMQPTRHGITLWGEAYGSWANIGSDGNASDFNRHLGGIVTGIDGMVNETWRLGLLLGHGSTSVNSTTGHASVDSYQVGLYGGAQWDAVGLRVGATFAQHEIDTARHAMLPGGVVNRHASSYDGQTVQLFGETGYRVDTAYGAIEPFAGARYVHLQTNGFQEDGGLTALTGLPRSTDVGVTRLGMRFSQELLAGENTALTARGMLGWSHAFGDVSAEQSLALAGGQAFMVEGLSVARDALVVEAGFDVGIVANAKVGLSYAGQFSGDVSENGIKADLTVRF